MKRTPPNDDKRVYVAHTHLSVAFWLDVSLVESSFGVYTLQKAETVQFFSLFPLPHHGWLSGQVALDRVIDLVGRSYAEELRMSFNDGN